MREYFNPPSKSKYPQGPWHSEPDKVQWVDEDTGLDCLIVRNGLGALCGYVGLPEGHRLFAECYDGMDDIGVHGGLTFSGYCDEPLSFEEWVAMDDDDGMFLWRKQKERGLEVGSTYQEYLDWHEANSICHIPEPEKPSKVWWLGFDCAHCYDLVPGMGPSFSYNPRDRYRDLEYVKGEVRILARQLRSLHQLAPLDEVPL